MLAGRKIWTAVLALVVLTGAGAAVRHFIYTRIDDAQRKVEVAVAEAATTRRQNQATLAQADSLKLEMEAVRREARSAVDAAAKARNDLVAQRVRTAVALTTAPDTCDVYIRLLQADVNAALAVADSFHVAADSLTRMDSTNTAQIARLTSSLTASQEALARLSVASTKLVQATKRPFFSRLLPKVGFGGTAGVSALTGRPDAVIGITLTWTP